MTTRTKKPLIAFVGPLMPDRTGASREKPWGFLLLSGGDSLKLEYKNKTEAISARRQICQNPNIYMVDSFKLLSAIQAALIHAKNVGTEGGDDPGDKDVL